ncbi:transposase family protein [Amycolatopsis sp. NPDC023774]|uniref:transposase family protein n=1 Tax=Amycolatopsis sp. NPDC023774 TaxID=3155015 RepID=UPI0033F772DB
MKALLPHLAGVQVEAVERAGQAVRITTRAVAASAACPGCRSVSDRVHGRYERRLLDTAAGGCEVVIRVEVRRAAATPTRSR